MQFTSYQFIFAFAPSVVLLHWLIPSRYRYLWLVIASYAFYSFWDWRYAGIMLFIAVVDYFLGIQIYKTLPKAKSLARLWLLLSVFSNLGLLVFFKYSNFIIGISRVLFDRADFDLLSLVLPLGISYFIFRSLSYTFDLYKSRCKPALSLLHYVSYVSFFPELLAGPIDRYKDLGNQIENPPQKLSTEYLNLGLFFFALGLVKKLLIADRVAYYSDPLWLDVVHLSAFEAWIATFAFSVQIYFDFAGYSLIAIGLGFLLGYKLPQNFNSPYRAKDISDFWRRWHMSLSFWFRDYVFFNIGGMSLNARWMALFVTMALCGFWHGASWPFIVWGAFHGLLLITHHLLREKKKRWKGGWFGIFGTFILVSISWVVFKSDSLYKAGLMYSKMLGVQTSISTTVANQGIDALQIYKLAIPNQLFVLIILGVTWAIFLPNLYDYAVTRGKAPNFLISVILGFLSAVAVILISDSSPFLYAQF